MGKNLNRFLLPATTPQCDNMHTKIIPATTPPYAKPAYTISTLIKASYPVSIYSFLKPLKELTQIPTLCLDRSGQIRPVATKVSYGLTPGTVCRFVTSPSKFR